MPPAFFALSSHSLLIPPRTAGSANPVAFHYPRPRFLFVPYSLSTLLLCSPVTSLSSLISLPPSLRPLLSLTFPSYSSPLLLIWQK